MTTNRLSLLKLFSPTAAQSAAPGGIARRITQLCLALLLLATGCTPLTDWVPSKTEVPHRVELPLILAPNGIPFVPLGASPRSEDPNQLTFGMLDTGAGVSIVTPQFASSHDLKRRGEPKLVLMDAHENEAKSHWVVNVDELELGDAKFHEFDAVVRELPAGGRIAMVLGRPLFHDVLLTIDYPHRRLVIENGALPEENGRDVLPMQRSRRGDLLIPATIAGEEAWMVLDTGAGRGGIPIADERAGRLKWVNQPVEGAAQQTWLGRRAARVGRIDADLKVGQYTFRQPIVLVADEAPADYAGADVLQRFVVTIDQRNWRVRLALPEAEAAAATSSATSSASSSPAPFDTPPLVDWGFQIMDAAGLVYVPPDSGAARAGLQSGDRILAIEDVPLSRYTRAHHEVIERGRHPVTLQVNRGGRLTTVRVPLKVVVP